MPSQSMEPELPAIRKLAERLAGQRGRATTLHLLAAVACRPSAAADLLNERELGAETLVALQLESTEPQAAFKEAVSRSRDMARRMGASQVGAAHVLVALLSGPRTDARRALDLMGADTSRLRAAAMNVGLGLIGRRRGAAPVSVPAHATVSESSEPPPRKAKAKGVAVPLFPPSARKAPSAASAEQGSAVAQVPIARQKPSSSGSAGTGRGERYALPSKKFPTLDSFGKNLTLAAARGELDPVVGREDEIEHALDVLAKRQGNNPCLIGPAGVGKTSVVRGLAQRIAEGKGGRSLDDRIIIELSISELLAGTGVRGALAARFGAIRAEVARAQGRVVLFLDEIHQLFVKDAADEVLGDLKLALARGQLPCIGATTSVEYAKYIETDAALARRFCPVLVDEPSREDAYLIIEALSERLGQHHHITYAPEALALSIAWSIRYLPGRALPDKALAILDLAGARAHRRGAPVVDPVRVAEVVEEQSGVPQRRLLESDHDRMLRLGELLGERVIGHSAALQRISRILLRNAAGLCGDKPIGTFLLLGPTGVGKTETAKAVAEVLFDSERAMTRIDMSEYSESHSVARLIGSPPGYIGHDTGGQLTEAVRARPYQVVLLDEIEKAHPEVLLTFLGVFDEGRLTDGRGKVIDFCNTVIIMTSNLGAREAESAPRRVGFGNSEVAPPEVDEVYLSAARGALPPELYNRIDEVIPFRPLQRADAQAIGKRMLDRLAASLEARHRFRVQFDAAVVDLLLDQGGFEPSLGVRPLKRMIARHIEGEMAERLVAGQLRQGDTLLVGVEGESLLWDVIEAQRSDSAAE